MRLSGLAGALVVALLSSSMAFGQTTTAKKSAGPKSSVAEKLMANERAVADAFAKRDVATINKLIMPGSWSVDEGGPMKIDDFVKNIKDMKIDNYKLSDMKVVPVTPSIQLVTYTMDQKGSFAGQPFPPKVYATTIWANHGGTWMAVFHQESTAAPKK